MSNDTEKLIFQFAGNLTLSYIETIACLAGSDSDSKTNLLLSIRNAELAKIDAIERALGISPTTAEIRRWAKTEMRIGSGKDG